jgi:hypothetical protein
MSRQLQADVRLFRFFKIVGLMVEQDNGQPIVNIMQQFGDWFSRAR